MSDDMTRMDMLAQASPMLFDDYPNRMSENCQWAAARIRELEASQDDHALMAAYQRGYLDGKAKDKTNAPER